MIKDCLFSLYDTPEDLKKKIRDGNMVCLAGVSCNYVNGQYINITGISDNNDLKLNEDLSLEKIISYIKPTNLFEIALCFKLYNYYKLNAEDKEEQDLKELFLNKFHEVEKYRIISPLLLDTRGWIVWRYQLYSILSLAVEPCEKINAYIRGLNAKKAELIKELQALKINNFYIYDAIRELTPPILNMTYSLPNLKDALILNDELELF